MRLHRIFFAAQALIFFLLAGYLWSWGHWLALLAAVVLCVGLPFAWWAGDTEKGSGDDG